MEKEEKIAAREKLADEMSFFGRLRQFYPAFALFYISIFRFLLYLLTQVKTPAATFIFPTQCLVIFNLPVTCVATFIS